MALIEIELMECGAVANKLVLSGDFEITQLCNINGSQKSRVLLSAKVEKRHFIEALRYQEVA